MQLNLAKIIVKEGTFFTFQSVQCYVNSGNSVLVVKHRTKTALYVSIQTSSESHINNGIQNSVLSSVNWAETSWTYGIHTFDVDLQKS